MRQAYQINRVDTTAPGVADVLALLHQICLPHDTLPDFSVGEWWLAWHHGEPVAFCGLKASEQWCDTGFLSRAGVVPEHRGRGLQKRLIRVRLARARALGWRHAVTYTVDNPPSANSLIACGFRMYHPQNPWCEDRVEYWRISF